MHEAPLRSCCNVEACLVEDCLGHGDAGIGCLERDCVVADFHLCRAVDVHADFLKHLLGEVHHPVVVFIRYVDLHAGELRIVGAVHAFVAEVLGELIYALEPAYDKAFEIKAHQRYGDREECRVHYDV